MPAVSVVTALLPLLPSIVQGVENLFGSKQGKRKKEVAANSAAEIIKGLRDSGLLKGDANMDEVLELVEAVFRGMKENGQLREDGQAERQVIFRGTLREVEES
jgi:hypothetical protein